MDPDLISKALDAIEAGDSAGAISILKSLIASAAGASPSEAPPPGDPVTESAEPASTDPSAPPDPKKNPAAYSAFMQLSKANDGLVTLAARVAELEAERAAEDLVVRRDLIADLVKLSAETPATAWQGDAAKLVPCKRLSAEPIAEMRARVAALKAARPKSIAIEPPLTSAPDITALSKAELKACKDRGLDPAEYIMLKQNAVKRIG
jgi:hypothetical protein